MKIKQPKYTVIKKSHGIELVSGTRDGVTVYGVKHEGYFGIPVYEIEFHLEKAEKLYNRWIKFMAAEKEEL